EDDPEAHLQMEFGFDVLQVAIGRYTPEKDHDFIGFAVARELLERAFFRTYGIELRDLFGNVDLSIGSFRHAVGQLVPEASRIAWEMNGDEMMQANPGLTREQFVYAPEPGSYEKEWGKEYESPSWLDKFLAVVMRVVPKFGTLAALEVV